MTGETGGRGMSGRLARLVVLRPWRVLGVALLVTAALAPLVLRVRLDTDLVDLMPRGAPGAEAFARFTRAFAAEQALIVLVEGSDGPRLTEFADRYAAALRARPGIVEVRSKLGVGSADLVRQHLLTLLDDNELDELERRATPAALATRVRRLRSILSAPGGSQLTPLVTADPMELLPLVGKRLSAGLPVDTTSGYFRSADGKALLLFVRPLHGPFDIEADRALLEDARRDAEKLGARAGSGDFTTLDTTPSVSFTGSYAYAVEYRDWLHRDMQVSTIVSAVTVLLFFALLLGALRALPLVALPLMLGLWATAATAGLFYGRVNAVSLAFGTILLSIGIDLPIQIYNRLREELGAGPTYDPRGAVERTMTSLAGPSLVATLGPAAVFAACALSRYRGLAELGVLAACGLVLNLLAMMTVLPALLIVLPARMWAPRGAQRTSGAWFAWLGRRASQRPRAVLAVVLVLAVIAIPAALRVRYDRKLISVEPPGMMAARVAREVERRMGGRTQLLVGLVEDRDGERALGRSDAWLVEAERLRQAGLLASYESVSTLFPSSAEQTRRRARIEKMGGARIAVDLRAALETAGFDVEPFAGFLAQLAQPATLTLGDAGKELAFLVDNHVHDEASGRVVATFLYPAPERSDEAIAALTKFAEAHGDRLTGVPILEEVLHDVVARDTVRVTAASVVLVFAILVLYYRRARPVIAIMVPLSFAWILFAAALGVLGLPLNLFNLVAVPLVVGYGIDDHVFLVHRHVDSGGKGPEHALASTGRAIVVTSLSTVAGFAGLAAARFDGLRLLGLSGALAVALCLLAAFAVLPALLEILWPRTKVGA